MVILETHKILDVIKTILRYYTIPVELHSAEIGTGITQGITPLSTICSLFNCTHKQTGKQYTVINTTEAKLEKQLYVDFKPVNDIDYNYIISHFKEGADVNDFKYNQFADDLEKVGALSSKDANQIRKIALSSQIKGIAVDSAYYITYKGSEDDRK